MDLIKVVKTGPDQPIGPVEPGTEHASGPVDAEKRFCERTGKKPLNWEKTGKKTAEPAGSSGLAVQTFFFSFPIFNMIFFFIEKNSKEERKKMKLKFASFP
jgi:hypothetical protein